MVLQKWRKLFEMGDFDQMGEVYKPDVFFEVNVPGPWRFQRQGVEPVIAQFNNWFGPDAMGTPTILNWKETPTDSGAVVEIDQRCGEGDSELNFHFAFLFVLDGDRIAEQTLYCPGPMDVETRTRWLKEETLIRP